MSIGSVAFGAITGIGSISFGSLTIDWFRGVFYCGVSGISSLSGFLAPIMFFYMSASAFNYFANYC